MIYALKEHLGNELLSQPETGMGYQIIEAMRAGSYHKNRYVVLNSEVVVEMSGNYGVDIRNVVNEGINKVKFESPVITLSSVKVFSEKEFRNLLNEKMAFGSAAIENPKEEANGTEEFVRLSAFYDDKRIDRTNRCLRPGSYTTTKKDYLICKEGGYNPVERYALPNEEKIQWAFFIIPKKGDNLQRGIVQPANGKPGGGAEAYFEKGTSFGTFNAVGKY
jgi:hypothetical protein